MPRIILDGLRYTELNTLQPSIECAAIPDGLPQDMSLYILDDLWQTDPLNPSVCWRLKTAQELDNEKEAIAQLLGELKPVIESVLEIIYENPDLNAAFATINLFKVAVKDRYKSKL